MRPNQSPGSRFPLRPSPWPLALIHEPRVIRPPSYKRTAGSVRLFSRDGLLLIIIMDPFISGVWVEKIKLELEMDVAIPRMAG